MFFQPPKKQIKDEGLKFPETFQKMYEDFLIFPTTKKTTLRKPDSTFCLVGFSDFLGFGFKFRVCENWGHVKHGIPHATDVSWWQASVGCSKIS